jgi:hypothetical protein
MKLDPTHRPAMQHFIGRFCAQVLTVLPQARIGCTTFEDEHAGAIVAVSVEYMTLAMKHARGWNGQVSTQDLADSDGRGELDQAIDVSAAECLRQLRESKVKPVKVVH